MSTPLRRGSLLIIVSGVSALLLVVSTAFLMRMRADAEEAALVVREAQSRVMLYAAMNYVQECSRLGWGQEAFGWNDVRDGSAGPRGAARTALSSGVEWPAAGSAARCPMYVMVQPPYAIRPIYAPNPITDLAYDRSLIARFTKPDPQPVANVYDGGSVDDGSFVRGISPPRPASENLAWFRVYRETRQDHDGLVIPTPPPVPVPAPLPTYEPYYDTVDLGDHHGIFVVACGAGATLGYRTFAEAPAGTFSDEAMFTYLRASERIVWYRLAWSPALGDFTLKIARNDGGPDFAERGPNGINISGNANAGKKPRAFFGTISWVQRLDREPPTW